MEASLNSPYTNTRAFTRPVGCSLSGWLECGLADAAATESDQSGLSHRNHWIPGGRLPSTTTPATRTLWHSDEAKLELRQVFRSQRPVPVPRSATRAPTCKSQPVQGLVAISAGHSGLTRFRVGPYAASSFPQRANDGGTLRRLRRRQQPERRERPTARTVASSPAAPARIEPGNACFRLGTRL